MIPTRKRVLFRFKKDMKIATDCGIFFWGGGGSYLILLLFLGYGARAHKYTFIHNVSEWRVPMGHGRPSRSSFRSGTMILSCPRWHVTLLLRPKQQSHGRPYALRFEAEGCACQLCLRRVSVIFRTKTPLFKNVEKQRSVFVHCI